MNATAETFDVNGAGETVGTPPPDQVPPPRTRRGRPFGSRNRTPPLTETPVVNEGAENTSPGDDKPARRKRAKPVDTVAWAKQLQGVHMLLAKMVPIQFQGKLLLEIDERESQQLATAIADVCKEYNLEIGGKVGAGFQLIATVAMIYGPRIYIVQQMKLQAQRAAAQQSAQAPPAESPLDVATARASNGVAAAN